MDVRCLKANELREELQPCSLDTHGLKAELPERLLAELEAKEPEDEWELEADDEPTNWGYLCTTRRLRPRGRGGSELEGTGQPPLPRLPPHPEPCGYSGPDGQYVMDNFIRQNQFYETLVIK